jgi:dienelactone hydrolase
MRTEGAPGPLPGPAVRPAAPVWWIVTAGMLAALLLGGGTGLLVQSAGDGVVRERTLVDGVPVTYLRPSPAADAPLPGLVVAHGFAGSAALMDGLATAWARAGFAVAVPDLAGHGASPAALPSGDDRAGLVGELGTVAGWLRDRPEVADRPAFLVGHSMGAGAVVQAALADPTTPSTVALSLPSASGIPPGEPAAPANLLLLWGSAEPARFAEAALAALQAGHPDAVPGTTAGAFADGTARRAQEVPGAEHLSILWRTETAQAVLDWLGPQVPGPGPGAPVRLDPRLLWAALAALGAVLAMVPAASLLLGNSRPAAVVAARPRRVTAALLAAMAAGSLAAAAAAPWTGLLPLAVGGHLAVWFVGAGATLLLFARARPEPAAGPRGTVAGVLLGLLMAVLLAVPARLSWAPVSLVGPRPLLVGLFVLVLMLWFGAEARLLQGPRGRRAAAMAVSRVLVVAVLLAGVPLLGAPGFLTLLLPLMVPLLGLLGAAGWIVAGRTASSWPPAAVQAVPLALLIGTTFPLLA